MPVKNVFIVGSGQRIRNNFIPGFRCLADHFKLLGLHSRTFANAKKVGDRHQLSAFPSYADSPIEEADVIVMSISTLAVPEVLKQIAPYAKGKHLVMDTPVLADFRHTWAMQYLSEYESVTIAEDYMNFPIYQLMRDVYQAGGIGRLKHINLFHSGFYYHGLALIRSFINFEYVRTFSFKGLGSTASVNLFGFSQSVKACITNPYQSGKGRTLVVGSEGAVTDIPDSADVLPHGLVEDVFDGERWVGHVIELNGRRWELFPEATNQLVNQDLEKRTPFNDQKTCGLIEVLRSIVQPNLNSDYGATQGLYDALFMQYSHKLPFFVDPLAYIGRQSVLPFLKMIGKLKSS